MPSAAVRRGTAVKNTASPAVAPIYVDSDDNILKMIPAGSGTTEVQIVDETSTQTISGDKTFTGTVVMSGAVTKTEFADGTAALPSITFSDDLNSGIYRIGADNVGASVGGAVVLNIAATAISPGVTDTQALGTTSLMWSDLFLASGGVINWNNGNVTLTHTAGKLVLAAPAPTSGINAFEVTMTGGSATPGTIRSIVGSATTYTSMTSGNIVGTRGQVTFGGNVTGTAFAYGTQGKIIAGANTINVGSSMVYGVMGQLDLSGTTVTAGYVAGVGSDIFGVSSGTVAADLFYGQHADGGTINSYLRAYGKATYAFEFDLNSGTAVTSVAAGSAASLWIRVRVDGTAYKVALLADS